MPEHERFHSGETSERRIPTKRQQVTMPAPEGSSRLSMHVRDTDQQFADASHIAKSKPTRADLPDPTQPEPTMLKKCHDDFQKIVVTFLGHDICCRVETSGCHILKTRLDKTKYPGRWACKFHCYCNASWTWIFRQGRWVCRFHCYCNTSWTLRGFRQPCNLHVCRNPRRVTLPENNIL